MAEETEMENNMNDLPIVPLAGSEGWANAYETGLALAERFPGQSVAVLAYACEYNDEGPTAEHAITSLVMEQQGCRGGDDWVWLVGLSDGSTWRATGGCDYTGWDCRSYLSWEQVS